ncbi:flagellin [Sandarakinorhabdus sp.]|jgi:flagellar hook-associated protein 3 FlgL|uniref:flagellin N-terminal helical domain-containing protein n=1 Tax=Sandarakinorhabdus sp. TaxID=1916663 RepID=UPI0028A86D6F|nr:flagellin [Sandarakinorhabdus sp.]
MIPPLSARVGHDAAVRRLKGLSEQLAVVQEQISTGKKLQKPGDDAIAFARIATLRRANQGAEVQREAMDAASARLSASEVALAGIADLAARAKELALSGRNGALNASDRKVLALEVRELLAAARGLAETRGADGEALFSGVGVAPSYADDAEGLAVWAGLGVPPEVATVGRRIAAGITGPEAFGVTEPLPPVDPLAPPPDPEVPPPPRQRNFFDSLAHLADSLEEPRPLFFAAAMDEAIAAMDNHIGGLAGAQALLGARAARLEAETDRLDRSQLELKSSLSKLEDTDMTEAIARLDRLSVVLEAAQASFARVSRLSLWDDIR